MEESASANPPRKKLRILVVDDQKDTAESLSLLLTVLGHEAEMVYDGSSAVDAARSLRPDLVLLDVGLPKIDGYEAARQIRTNDPEVVLVALTGWNRDEDRERASKAGIDVYIVKPIDPTRLRTLLHQIDSRARDASVPQQT